jgi:hypothetical protein
MRLRQLFWVAGCLLVAAPAWRLTWAFHEDRVERRFGAFGIRWTRAYALPLSIRPFRLHVKRIEADDASRAHPFLSLLRPAVRNSRYAVQVSGSEGQQVVLVDALTEGEAHWIAFVLLGTFSDRFSATDNQPANP